MAIPVTFTVFNNSPAPATITGFNFVDDAGISHIATLTNFGIPGVFTGISTATSTVIPAGGQLDFITHYTTSTTTLGRYTGTITVSASTNIGPQNLTATNLVLISTNPVPDPNAVVIAGGGGNGGGGGGGGGWDIIPILIGIGIALDCFTPGTQVLMEDGTTKDIVDVALGERVWNKDKTAINTVKFIERVIDTEWEYLYTPDKAFKPFATTNHPLYINGQLSVPNPVDHYRAYPWLGDAVELTSCTLEKTAGRIVYNLWVDGDHTYQVNGYGTTSIMSPGWLNQSIDYGYITYEQALVILNECSNTTRNLRTGSYWVNKFVGWMDITLLSKSISYILVANGTIFRKVFITAMKTVGLAANIYYALRKRNV
jgi:hypothetical protein